MSYVPFRTPRLSKAAEATRDPYICIYIYMIFYHTYTLTCYITFYSILFYYMSHSILRYTPRLSEAAEATRVPWRPPRGAATAKRATSVNVQINIMCN